MEIVPPELINLKKFDPSLVIEAAYYTTNTFLKAAIYPANKLFLMKPAARRLAQVQSKLQEQNLGLLIWDAYRPLSLQKVMWDMVGDDRYISNPKTGSRHNRGCAVDCTLIDSNKNQCLMPTKYGDFSEHAHRDYMDIPAESMQNRQILQDAMVEQGFIPLHEEWWHFDAPEWRNYPVLDINPYEDVYRNIEQSNE